MPETAARRGKRRGGEVERRPAGKGGHKGAKGRVGEARRRKASAGASAGVSAGRAPEGRRRAPRGLAPLAPLSARGARVRPRGRGEEEGRRATAGIGRGVAKEIESAGRVGRRAREGNEQATSRCAIEPTLPAVGEMSSRRSPRSAHGREALARQPTFRGSWGGSNLCPRAERRPGDRRQEARRRGVKKKARGGGDRERGRRRGGSPTERGEERGREVEGEAREAEAIGGRGTWGRGRKKTKKRSK